MFLETHSSLPTSHLHQWVTYGLKVLISGLSFLHDNSIALGMLQPSNVWVTESGEMKIYGYYHTTKFPPSREFYEGRLVENSPPERRGNSNLVLRHGPAGTDAYLLSYFLEYLYSTPTLRNFLPPSHTVPPSISSHVSSMRRDGRRATPKSMLDAAIFREGLCQVVNNIDGAAMLNWDEKVSISLIMQPP